MITYEDRRKAAFEACDKKGEDHVRLEVSVPLPHGSSPSLVQSRQFAIEWLSAFDAAARASSADNEASHRASIARANRIALTAAIIATIAAISEISDKVISFLR